VGRDGAITVPYAGRVRVAGSTTRAVQRVIERSLAGKAIQPQALVNVVKPHGNTVTLGGEAAALGQRVPLSARGDRLLDVIAQAGGVKAPVSETYVELQRGSASARVSLALVTREPRENIYMRAGDVVTLVRDPQTFLAYGATGVSGEIPFSADGVTLAQALSKSGGLQDSRSDPHGVFVVRYEQPSVVRALRPESRLASGPGPVPVVYSLDMLNPSSLFLEQRFPIANRDLIYVSNAPLADTAKVVQIFTGLLTPVSQGASIAYDVNYLR
jgi:polysaccharide export outer membrane protein